MKGIKIILIILILFIFLNFIADVKEGKITTKSIFDIRAVQVVGTRISLTVDANPPNVFINSPLNTTYNYNISINLNFTVFDDISQISKIWYNINNGNNVTVTGNTTFDVPEGSNTLYFFANDSVGLLNNSRTITFFINTSKGYNITNTEFTGQTTNFNSLTKQLQSNISNAVLNVPSYGKITFNENISITSDFNLDNNIEIGNNQIIINSNNIPNFNKSTTLELYSLTLTNPKIQRDDVDCPSTICKINSYAGGILSFNVTQFTKYSAAETSTGGGVPGGGTGGTGGGGGGSVTKVDNIKINKDAIKIKLKQDETISDFLKIENKEDRKIRLTLTIEPEIEFLFIEDNLNEYILNIDALEKRNVELKVHAIDIKEGVYVSKLIIESDNFRTVLPVVIEVVSKGPTLFDVEVSISDENKIVEQGDKLITNFILFNLGVTGIVDTKIEYNIVDLDGNIVVSETEREFVETQLQKVKEIKLPKDIKLGNYVYAVKVTYFDGKKEVVSTSTTIFEVVSKKVEFPFKFGLNFSSIVMVALLIIIIVLIIYQFRVLRTLERLHIRKKKKKK